VGRNRNRTPVCRYGGGCGEMLCLEHTGATGGSGGARSTATGARQRKPAVSRKRRSAHRRHWPCLLPVTSGMTGSPRP
jgi:hypothetical protein